MYRIFHKANVFNMLKHSVALTCACRTKVRTNDLQSQQLPVLVRSATVGNYREELCYGGRISPIPFKNGLSVRFGSDDSGTPVSSERPSPSGQQILAITDIPRALQNLSRHGSYAPQPA
jgi:hypothetical protein